MWNGVKTSNMRFGVPESLDQALLLVCLESAPLEAQLLPLEIFGVVEKISYLAFEVVK